MSDHTPDDQLAEAARRITDLPPGTEFATSEIAQQLRDEGWPPLPEPRALGGTVRKLCRAGLIVKSGAAAHASRSHGGIATMWRRTHNHS
ncbi:hypothetical protein [Nocardia asteroides]|uniref:hypothetical protein n=1 Tax=Nocardia asteroides TaxID=1824 RepID=UPI0033D2CE63